MFNAKPPEFQFERDDVYECKPTAGGGWGDPIERAPEDVASDVARGVFSAEVAAAIFAVLTVNGELDLAATHARRRRMRAQRLSWPVDKTLAHAPVIPRGAAATAIVGDVAKFIQVQGETYFVCNCGTPIAPARENWKDYARHALVTAKDLGPRVRLHEDLEVVRYACPSCMRLLDVEVKRKGEASLFDIQVAS